MSKQLTPQFHHVDFLEQHAKSILAFYENRVVAPEGFYQCFKDNGEVYDTETQHLVSLYTLHNQLRHCLQTVRKC